MGTTDSPRYCDFYGMMSYADFLAAVAAGTLSLFIISQGTDEP